MFPYHIQNFFITICVTYCYLSDSISSILFSLGLISCLFCRNLTMNWLKRFWMYSGLASFWWRSLPTRSVSYNFSLFAVPWLTSRVCTISPPLPIFPRDVLLFILLLFICRHPLLETLTRLLRTSIQWKGIVVGTTSSAALRTTLLLTPTTPSYRRAPSTPAPSFRGRSAGVSHGGLPAFFWHHWQQSVSVSCLCHMAWHVVYPYDILLLLFCHASPRDLSAHPMWPSLAGSPVSAL